MRVLITADCVGGIWRYAIDVGRELAGRGAEVVLACLGPRPSDAHRTEANAASLDLVWLGAELDWMTRCADGLRPGAVMLEALIRERSPDVVHLNAPALAAYMDHSRPAVVAAHSCVATWWKTVKKSPLPDTWQWNADATKAGLSTAGCVVAPTHAFASMLRAAYGPLPRLVVIGNGTKTASSAPKENHAFAVGRWWDEGKNARVLDAAAAASRVPVLAAGPLRGPNGAAATLRAAHWLGELTHDAILMRGARAKIFVSPARYEPFGLAVLEAAAAGAALALADTPTFRELWDGAAMFFPPDDAAALAELIDRIEADDALRSALAAAAMDRAADFTIERQVDGLLAAYALASADYRRVA